MSYLSLSIKSCIGATAWRSISTCVARSNIWTTAGMSFDCSPAFSLLSESSYDPWNTASPTHAVCEALNRFIISPTASPFVPPIACQKENLVCPAAADTELDDAAELEAGAFVAAGADEEELDAGTAVGAGVGDAQALSARAR